jgi:peptidoglycan/xylan/chitin deacetylase (PgdA/CDA1 family)
MYFIKTPQIFKFLLNDCLWSIPTNQKVIYLTFDDGPTAGVTEWVLDTLTLYSANATFFSIAKNIEQNPELYQRILSSGHSVGNHTYDHLNGLMVCTDEYLNNIQKASQWIDSRLFRPPYGKMTYDQYKNVKKLYRVVMWDLLSGDFDSKMSPKKSISKLKSGFVPGSIVTFHDSKKAQPLLMTILPEFLQYCQSQGYRFNAIPMVKIIF